MLHEHVELLEGTLVEQHGDTLTSRVLTSLVLFLDGLLTTAEASLLALLDQLSDFV